MVTRRGFVLNTAFACLIILSLMVAVYFVYVRGQTRLTQNVLAGEKAYHLAQGGVAAGIGYFTNTKEFSRLYSDILAGKPAPQLDGSTETLPPTCEAIEKMISAARGDASVTVELTLLGFKPFPPPDPGSGITADPVEKRGILRITSTADYQGTKRRVVAYKEVKAVNILPYVVSKFSLFSAEHAPGDSPNRIQMKKLDLVSAEPKSENRYAPLFMRNGPGKDAEANGWIFLGGDDWRLNLTWGEKGWGDQWQLLRRPWEVARASATALPLPPAYHGMLLQRGFFEGIKADNKLFAHYDFDAPPEDPVGEGCALIRPYGIPSAQAADSEVDVSPTYVLGRVLRRWMDLRYVKRVADQRVVYMPYALPPDFAGPAPAPWPAAQSYDPKTVVFGNVYPFFADYMSNVVVDTKAGAEETFNRAADYLDDTQDLEPPHRLNPVKLSHASGAPNFLYDAAQNVGYVAIKNSANRELFRGWLHQLVSRDFRIEERATFKGDAGGFKNWLAKTPKQIPGIVYFTGGDIVIDRALAVESGGIIAADGSITVAAPVSVRPGGKPLSLISLKGSVRVATHGTVQASLVALEGAVTREPGAPPLHVIGNVVAHRLSFTELCEGQQPGKVIYDPRLDPTASGSETTAYSVQLSPWRTDYLPPVD